MISQVLRQINALAGKMNRPALTCRSPLCGICDTDDSYRWVLIR